MDNKHILIVTSEFPPQPGGIGRHAFDLGEALALNQYECEILTNSRGLHSILEERDFDDRSGIRIHRIARKGPLLFVYLKRFFVVIKFLFDCKYKAVIFTGKFSLWMANLTYFLGKRSTVIAVVHGSELTRKGWKSFFLKTGLNACDAIVPVSNFTLGLLPTVSSKIRLEVIPNGINFSRILNGEIANSEVVKSPVLLTVGSLHKRKGQHNVIAALPKLVKVHSNLEYHMIGLPKTKIYLQDLSYKLKVSDYIHFHGAVNDDELWRIMDYCSIFIMLSENLESGDVEGFGIAILEANLRGLPAIGSIGCGIEDAINHGFSGFLVNPKDPIEILHAVNTILDNYAMYSENAKDWAQRFDWNVISNRYIALIKE